MYGQEATTREMIIDEYSADLKRLLQYLPWLRKKNGAENQKYYEGDGNFKLIPVPVYDSTLLGFIKLAQSTKFVDRNYPYVYRRHHLETPAQERKAMENAKITDIDIFKGIMSRYILEGQRKGIVWTTAVSERIFVTALECMEKIFFEYGAEETKKVY